ncbi:hypothetical protein llap_4809 [Limosa lapponica baueri]|uniref:Uncharacterized protein n=1 Tax=Limosa lapponica baueri TaxID=1758121 RepID=A0A2I0UFQ1_LIMLA|nr:hypothetical protein llap_4809 [Limosa lapponica baueri]
MSVYCLALTGSGPKGRMSFSSCDFGTLGNVCIAEHGETENEPTCSFALLHQKVKRLIGSSLGQRYAIPPPARTTAGLVSMAAGSAPALPAS